MTLKKYFLFIFQKWCIWFLLIWSENWWHYSTLCGVLKESKKPLQI